MKTKVLFWIHELRNEKTEKLIEMHAAYHIMMVTASLLLNKPQNLQPAMMLPILLSNQFTEFLRPSVVICYSL